MATLKFLQVGQAEKLLNREGRMEQILLRMEGETANLSEGQNFQSVACGSFPFFIFQEASTGFGFHDISSRALKSPFQLNLVERDSFPDI